MQRHPFKNALYTFSHCHSSTVDSHLENSDPVFISKTISQFQLKFFAQDFNSWNFRLLSGNSIIIPPLSNRISVEQCPCEVYEFGGVIEIFPVTVRTVDLSGIICIFQGCFSCTKAALKSASGSSVQKSRGQF